MGMYRHQKHFTVEEAKALLPEIKNKTKQLQVLRNVLKAWGYDIYRHEYLGGTGPNGKKYHPPELEELVGVLKSIERMGVLIKNLEEVLVDFPHLRSDGEEVYLCWKEGEESLEHWHTIPEGFIGRKPLEEL